MVMKTSDAILGPSRGTAAIAIAYAKTHGAARLSDVVTYINTVYTIAPQVKIDPAIVIAQAMHETGDANGNVFVSSWWQKNLNPAGIGITGDAKQNALSHVWHSGDIAAKSHIAHLLLYATGQISGGGLNTSHDVRYAEYVKAYGNKAAAKTIADLAGKWAVDPNYANGIVARGNACFFPSANPTYAVAGLSQPISLPVPLVQKIIPVGQTNQRPGIARQTPGYIVVHETANTAVGADADMHARYLAAGADGSQVSWHFTVDDHHIVQNIPVNEVTWQAADGSGPGNMSGVSMELCVNADGNETKTRHNAEALAAGLAAALGLSPDRIKRHYDFNQADPDRHHCPDHIMNEGYWPTFVANASAIMGGTTPMPTPTPAETVTYPTGMDAGIATQLFGSFGTWAYAEGGTLSNLWLDYGTQHGVWPKIINVILAKDSATITRTYWQFSNGLTFFRPNDQAPVVQLT